jgi:hypothetical protein
MSQLQEKEIFFLNNLREQRGNSKQIAQQLNQSIEYIEIEKERLKGVITKLLITYLKNNFEIPDQIDTVDTKIVMFVEKWMSTHPKYQKF